MQVAAVCLGSLGVAQIGLHGPLVCSPGFGMLSGALLAWKDVPKFPCVLEITSRTFG